MAEAELTARIGGTPLVALPSPNPRVAIFGKLEGNNPGGSVKDRPAWFMIRGAELRGELATGVALIEPTSGNTGIALAMIAAARGYRIDLVMPADSTAERVNTVRAFGANVILTPAKRGMEGAIDLAHRRVAAGGFRMLDQFANADNPRAHYETTGPEIWRATQGRVTHFVSAMGTTGTIMGVSRYLKEQRADVHIIGCQPTEGSRIPGIRRWPKAYLPKIFDASRVDRIIDVDQLDAERKTRDLAARSGQLYGVSSGGAVWAAQALASELGEGLVICVLCDRGDRYLSSDLYAPAHARLGDAGLGKLEIVEA